MYRKSACRCLICDLEQSLTEQFAEYQHQFHYREFVSSRSLLSAFPTATDLVSYLHTSRNSRNGIYPVDRILGELLQTNANSGSAGVLRDLLLLAFVPMLHATLRQVANRYSSLENDDIAQHSVASLLQLLNSPEFYARTSHAAFAISRMLRRSAFEWAERECRSPVYETYDENMLEMPATAQTPEPIERGVLLRHFLHRSHQRGLLSGEDLQLLVQFKLDAASDAKLGVPAAIYSNASRQKMKRLLNKLRGIAAGARLKPGCRSDSQDRGTI
jgi:hypothetical protein